MRVRGGGGVDSGRRLVQVGGFDSGGGGGSGGGFGSGGVCRVVHVGRCFRSMGWFMCGGGGVNQLGG